MFKTIVYHKQTPEIRLDLFGSTQLDSHEEAVAWGHEFSREDRDTHYIVFQFFGDRCEYSAVSVHPPQPTAEREANEAKGRARWQAHLDLMESDPSYARMCEIRARSARAKAGMSY